MYQYVSLNYFVGGVMATATSTNIELATVDLKHEQLPSSEEEEDRSFDDTNHIGM